VNPTYIVIPLQEFLRKLNRKRPKLVNKEWFLHWDNATMHSAKLVQDYLAAVDFFLFLKLKKELAEVTMTPEEFKKEWCRLLRSTAKEKFCKAVAKWLEGCQKCVRIGSMYVEKSYKMNTLLSLVI